MSSMGKRSGSKNKKDKVILPPELPPDLDDGEVELSEEDLEFYGADEGDAYRFPKFEKKFIDSSADRCVFSSPAVRRVGNCFSIKRGNSVLEGTSRGSPARTRARSSASTGRGRRRPRGRAGRRTTRIWRWTPSMRSPSRRCRGSSSTIPEEVKEELSAEELCEKKKAQLSELGMAMLEEPESNIGSLNDMLIISNDKDQRVVKLGLMSLLAVFRDIIPSSYRIRQLTEKELVVEVSKEVKKMRYSEYTLIRCYKAYLQKLISLEKQPHFYPVAVRCLCALLNTAPHLTSMRAHWLVW